MKYKLIVFKVFKFVCMLCLFLLGFVAIHYISIYWSDISSLILAVATDISLNYLIYLIAFFAFSFGLTILVSAHEFGHMWTAKQFNVFVIEYSIGWGKLLWSKTYNETQYSIRLLPLGGYVKLAGHYGQNARNDNRDFDRLARWKKFIVMGAGVFVNIILAFVLFTGLYYVGTSNQYLIQAGTTIGRVLPGSNEDISGIKTGDTVIAVNKLPVSKWSEISVQYILAESVSVMNLEIERDSERYDVSIPILRDKIGNAVLKMAPVVAMDVVSVEKGSLAELYGFREFDRIVTINDRKINGLQEGYDYFMSELSSGRNSIFGILRDGQNVTINFEIFSQAEGIKSTGLGLGFATTAKYDLIPAMYESVNLMAGFFQDNVRVVYATTTCEVSPEKTFASPVAIASFAGRALSDGVGSYVFFIALISFALGFMNLLPLPALDGGHMLFLTIEMISRRELPLNFKIMVINLSMIFLMLLLFYLLFFEAYFLTL